MTRYGDYWKPYVPVAARRAQARRKMDKLRKAGQNIQPVTIAGRTIARSFWGKAWCDHLESFSDYSNRLPRGRTYVRNGSVCHLEILKGAIHAIVSGSELYHVTVKIKELSARKWNEVKERCSGSIGSLLELLQGQLSEGVMEVVTDRGKGLFPRPVEIRLGCDCPDWAVMCKHVAAVLYGVGARLDEQPELLFLLRGVNHEELISTEAGVVAATRKKGAGGRRLAANDISDVFGIEMVKEPDARSTRRKNGSTKKVTRKKAASRAKVGSTRKGTSTVRKPAASSRGARARRAGGRRKVDHQGAVGNRPVTGKAVADLRTKLGMSKNQFATLLEVSVATVGNWERTRGRLNLLTRTLSAWNAAVSLTKRAAWKRLESR